MKSRREARECALRVLYAYDLSGNPLDLAIQQVTPRSAQGQYHQFMLDLVRTTVEKQDWFVVIIRQSTEKWELTRIAVLDRLILRMAICELSFFNDIPPKVSINEAIEIAKKYSTEKSDKFVNGVLDAVMHRHTPGEELPKRRAASADEG